MRHFRTADCVAVGFHVVLLSLIFHHDTYAQGSQKNCKLIECENNPSCRLVEPDELKLVNSERRNICDRIARGDWTYEQGNEALVRSIVVYSICNASTTNPEFVETQILIRDDLCPARMKVAVDEFCYRTHDPTAYNQRQDLSKNVKWLGKELFCQVTSCVARDDSWLAAFAPDTPAQQRLEAETEKLCEEVRNGEIVYRDAVYKWNQEFIRWNERVGSETAAELGKQVVEILEDALKNITE